MLNSIVVFGLNGLGRALIARAALASGEGDTDFYEAKLATGRYYMARQLPMTATHLARIQSGAEPDFKYSHLLFFQSVKA